MVILIGTALLMALSLLLGRPVRFELADDDQQQLLRLARRQLEATAAGEGLVATSPSKLSPRLSGPGAAFVSIYVHGELRGCMIDQFDAHEPLHANVLRNTQLAAEGDPRFPPITTSDLPDTRLEISVVHRIRQVAFSSHEELLRALTPFEDGVILSADGRLATFLPSVWQTYPSPEEFLTQLCLKAGLAADRWQLRPYPAVQTYAALAFGEPEG
jgi:AmmeMemoRadiSam system protein A